jgi:hypothetical protein
MSDSSVVTGSTPDDELINKILVLLGVDPADWSSSLSGIYAAIRSNMQIGEPHMTKIEDWTDAAEITADTLTAVMFKLVERAEKAQERYAHEGGKPQVMTMDILKRWIAYLDVPTMTDIYQTNIPNIFYASFAAPLYAEHKNQLVAIDVTVTDTPNGPRNRYMLKWNAPADDEE